MGQGAWGKGQGAGGMGHGYIVIHDFALS